MNQKWTTENIPDLSGKIMIVTGANSGIGYEAAKEFARKGALTILACRNMDKAQIALSKIMAEIPTARVEIMPLDLTSLKSIHQFAGAFKSRHDRLDVLLNNAGIMMVPNAPTEGGFESQFGTNHLGHFALTGLLIDLLEKTPGSRVVNVSSNAHRFRNMDFDHLMYKEGNGYSPVRAYGRNKLANLLFTYEPDQQLKLAGAGTIAVAAHPGTSATNLSAHLYRGWLSPLGHTFMRYFAQSAAMGALPLIRAAVDLNVSGGQYYGPDRSQGRRGYPIIVESSEASHNETDARRLWQVSEDLTRVKYLS